MVRAVGSLSLPDVALVVTGLSVGPSGARVRYLGLERDNQDFVAAADLVISTAGKSTIDEAVSYGSPLIVIPIRHHSEQERNAVPHSGSDTVTLTILTASSPDTSVGGLSRGGTTALSRSPSP